MKIFNKVITFLLIGCLFASYLPVNAVEVFENTEVSAFESADEELLGDYVDFEYDDIEIFGSNQGIELRSGFVTGIGNAVIKLSDESLEITTQILLRPPTFYSVNGGGSWKKFRKADGTWNLPTRVEDDGAVYKVDITKLLNKKLNLRLSWADTSSAAKTSSMLSFSEINARRRGNFDKLKIFYNDDNTWELERNGLRDQSFNDYQWAKGTKLQNITESDWKSFVALDRKTNDHGTTRETIWFRRVLEEDKSSIVTQYHPVSKPFRLRPRNLLKEPNVKFSIKHANQNRSCTVTVKINKNLDFSLRDAQFNRVNVATIYNVERLAGALLEVDATDFGDFHWESLYEEFGVEKDGFALRIQKPGPANKSRPASKIKTFRFGDIETELINMARVCYNKYKNNENVDCCENPDGDD